MTVRIPLVLLALLTLVCGGLLFVGRHHVFGAATSHPGRSEPAVPTSSRTPLEPPQRPPSPTATSFRVATFNVLGASHTRPDSRHRGWASGSVRARTAVRVLLNNGVDVAGLQEFEPSQFHIFREQTRDGWDAFPGLKYGARALANSIVWRRDTWQFVRAELFGFPYFHGRQRLAPLIVLRNVASARDVVFMNVHNPATTGHRGDNKVWRTRAVHIEGRHAARMMAAGYPVVVTGDFNEVAPAFCALTANYGLAAASGGKRTPRVCAPSPIAGVDWIFGSPEVRFHAYARTQTPLVRRTSDHPIVVATARIAGG